MEKLGSILRPLRFALILVVLVLAYAASLDVVKPDLGKLISSTSKSADLLGQLLSPEIIENKPVGESVLQFAIPSPCGSADEGVVLTEGARIYVEPKCAASREKVRIIGEGLEANVKVTLKWLLPSGDYFSVSTDDIFTDADGRFEREIEVRPIVATKDGKASEIVAFIDSSKTVTIASPTLVDVLNNVIITIFMALMATTFGALIAAPLGFLAASNITKKGFLGSAVYYITRSFLSILRSLETMVLGLIFALIVGFGSPFGGVLALTIVTAASLGKMFSEAVESIDKGTIEAINATGSNPLNVVRYGVVPQVLQDFLSFVIYHWDINVRISTILGFVGAGGIGYYIQLNINTLQYSKAGTAILAIVIVVWSLDFLSTELRKKLV